jgi:hypothetical protein
LEQGWSEVHCSLGNGGSDDTIPNGADQLASLRNTPERQRQELEFCSVLDAVLLAVKGVAAPEVGHAYACARGL